MMLRTLLILLSLGGATLAADGGRILFNFENTDAAKQWQSVNGGFASVRTRPSKLALNKEDTFVARVRGDGRKYNFNLYVPRPLTAFSYRADFETKKDEWIEIEIPLDEFEAPSFGRVVQNQPLDPTEFDCSLGIEGSTSLTCHSAAPRTQCCRTRATNRQSGTFPYARTEEYSGFCSCGAGGIAAFAWQVLRDGPDFARCTNLHGDDLHFQYHSAEIQ